MTKKLAASIGVMGLLLLLNTPLGFGSSPEQTATAHKLAGDAYLRAGNAHLAIEEYQKAIALNSYSTTLYFNLAIALYAMGKIEASAQALEKLLALDPQDVEAHYNLACLSLYREDTVTAAQHFEKAKICCHPDSRFIPLIDKGLGFLKELKNADPSTQGVLFFLLQQGLPPVLLTTVAS